MFKIAIAMKKIHLQGMGHLDIKGANVFMADKFTPVIGDLGFM